MSLETILSERETLLSNVEEDKSEIADIELKMSAISDEQLSPIEQEIQQKQNELDRIKKMSGYSDLSNKKKDLNKGIEKKLKDSKMFVYKYLAQHILNKKRFYNKWSKLFVSDKEPLQYKIEGVIEGKEKEFLEFIISLDNNTLRSLLWTTGYKPQEIGPDYPTLEFLNIGEKYPQFGEKAKFYFLISNFFFSTKLPEKDRDVYKRIDGFFGV